MQASALSALYGRVEAATAELHLLVQFSDLERGDASARDPDRLYSKEP